MFRVLSAIFLLTTTAAFADAPAAKPTETECPPGKPCAVKPNGLTVDECLKLLPGLNGLDGYGSGTNFTPYKFGNGRLRGIIQQDIAALNVVVQEDNKTTQAIYKELSKGEPEIKQTLDEGKTTNPVYIEYINQINDSRKRECHAPLAHIRMDDLKLDINEIPGSILGVLDPILDK